MSIVQRITMDDAKAEFGDLSLTNQYQVHFAGFNQSIIKYLRETGISNAKDYISRKMGIMCADASLPASALATGDVKDNFMGVSQEFAHSRLYTDIDFTFYLSSDYTLLKIFEGWMDYITSGANGEVQESEKSFYRRLRYPDDYKIIRCISISLKKIMDDHCNINSSMLSPKQSHQCRFHMAQQI